MLEARHRKGIRPEVTAFLEACPDGAVIVASQTELGVEGDAHCGRTVKHRSRVARDPALVAEMTTRRANAVYRRCRLDPTNSCC